LVTEVPGVEGVLVADAGRDRDPVARTHTLVQQTLAHLRNWLADESLAGSRLIVATRGAVAVLPGEDVDDLAGAAVWGLVRSAQSENPERILLVDVGDAADLSTVLPTVLAAGFAVGEWQVAVRDGVCYLPRLVPAGSPRPGSLSPPVGDEGWRLDITTPGTLDNLTLSTNPEANAPLAAGQVRVAVRAAWLNFRDVLIALGMYPDTTTRIGSEAAGIVVETAPDVTDLAVGQRVMGLFSGAAGPLAVTDRRLLIGIPQGWTYPQAAAIPVVYLTAYYALHDLAGLQAGQSVLIHAATGGVGTAAVQLAQHARARIYATASPHQQQGGNAALGEGEVVGTIE